MECCRDLGGYEFSWSAFDFRHA